jgi:hypothetical protein
MRVLKKDLFSLSVILLGVFSGASGLAAQQYAIDWSVVSGGGGTATGGQYSVSGSVGQPATDTVSGGNYVLTGGFWSFAAPIQMPGAQLLSIKRSGANLLVSWPSPSTGFGLEQNSSLGTTSWTSVAQIPNDDGFTKSIIVTASSSQTFYRLRKLQ